MNRVTEYVNPFAESTHQVWPFRRDSISTSDIDQSSADVSLEALELAGQQYLEDEVCGLSADRDEGQLNLWHHLLTAADPTRSEWYRAGWFQDQDINPQMASRVRH